jgi:8-oxo-dGTP diphosphatase
MIFAQTERLTLRALEKTDLARMVEMLSPWDVVRWLTVVPFPYTMHHAEEFYKELQPSYASGMPQFFAVEFKSDNMLIGGVGLHPPRGVAFTEGEVEIGYFLDIHFWGRGLTSEAARAVVDLSFGRPATRAISASTEPKNQASQNVLRTIGLQNRGITARDYPALRGDDQIVKWLLMREEWAAAKTRAPQFEKTSLSQII